MLARYCKYELFKMLLVYSARKHKSPEDSITARPRSREPGARLLSPAVVSAEEKSKATCRGCVWKDAGSAACPLLSQQVALTP